MLATSSVSFQVGSNVGETIDVNLTSLSLQDLGLDALDVVNLGNTAITAHCSVSDRCNARDDCRIYLIKPTR